MRIFLLLMCLSLPACHIKHCVYECDAVDKCACYRECVQSAAMGGSAGNYDSLVGLCVRDACQYPVVCK